MRDGPQAQAVKDGRVGHHPPAYDQSVSWHRAAAGELDAGQVVAGHLDCRHGFVDDGDVPGGPSVSGGAV